MRHGRSPRAEARIREVGPRDGFQNEPEVIATDDKVALIDALARTGLRRLEITSFVRADVIPQLADAARCCARDRRPGRRSSRSVLVPNERGLDNALALREHFDEINCSCRASETHNRHNVNRSVEESLAALERVLPRARAEGLRCEAVISVRLRLPLRGPRRPRSACSRSPGAWPKRARRRSASATRPAWPTRARSSASSTARARRRCPDWS